MASIFSGPKVGLRPRPGATSHKLSIPSCAKRPRHKMTVFLLISSSRATALSDRPAAAASTIRLRKTTCWGVPCKVSQRPISSWSLVLNSITGSWDGMPQSVTLGAKNCPVICWTLH